MRPFIVLGDKSSCGGVVVSAAANARIDGKPIARLGDKVACAKRCKRPTCTIVSGDPTMIVEGKPVARHGDKTACGDVLIASQAQTTVE